MLPLDFIQSSGFTKDWEDYRLDDDDLQELENTIRKSPRGAPVIRGTGGLRKLRFVPMRSRRGKRGGFRVCYVYFEKYESVYLVTIYAKTDQADLSSAGRKKMSQLIKNQEADLARRK